MEVRKSVETPYLRAGFSIYLDIFQKETCRAYESRRMMGKRAHFWISVFVFECVSILSFVT